jgi:hypothetical protein
MRFGKFLTTQRVISAAHVLAALAEQARRRAYLPQLLADAGVVPPELALEYDPEALRNDEELLVDSYRRGLVTARQYHSLETQWRSSTPPLGEVLVEQGLLTSSQLQALLAEFHEAATHGDRVAATRA